MFLLLRQVSHFRHPVFIQSVTSHSRSQSVVNRRHYSDKKNNSNSEATEKVDTNKPNEDNLQELKDIGNGAANAQFEYAKAIHRFIDRRVGDVTQELGKFKKEVDTNLQNAERDLGKQILATENDLKSALKAHVDQFNHNLVNSKNEVIAKVKEEMDAVTLGRISSLETKIDETIAGAEDFSDRFQKRINKKLYYAMAVFILVEIFFKTETAKKLKEYVDENIASIMEKHEATIKKTIKDSLAEVFKEQQTMSLPQEEKNISTSPSIPLPNTYKKDFANILVETASGALVGAVLGGIIKAVTGLNTDLTTIGACVGAVVGAAPKINNEHESNLSIKPS